MLRKFDRSKPKPSQLRRKMGIPEAANLLVPQPDSDQESSVASRGESVYTYATTKAESIREELISNRYMKVVLPHVGLVLLLLLYTVVGAGLFHLIELPHEITARKEALQQMQETKEIFVQNLWNLSQDGSVDDKEWKRLAILNLEKIEEIVFEASKHKYVELADLRNQSSMVWTFSQSLFFCCTIITTIGYGHMVPLTLEGRILAIVFGLFGIPLMLITIADIGKFMSDWINAVYRTYRAFRSQLKRHAFNSSKRVRESEAESGRSDPSETTSDSENMSVPAWVVLLFLASYTALGGLLFQFLEGWPYFESFYFCFVTMATIGFGDIVPSEQTFMLITLVYIVIGLAMATMCIDLAGTEYIRRIHYFGQRIEHAKGTVQDALHLGEDIWEQMRQAGEKFGPLGRARDQLPPHLRDLADSMPPGQSMDINTLLHLYQRQNAAYDIRDGALSNILWEPLSPQVRKHLKKNIRVLPDEIKEGDAFILQNKVFEKPLFGPEGIFSKEHNDLMIASRMKTLPRKCHSEPKDTAHMIAPFLAKESDV